MLFSLPRTLFVSHNISPRMLLNVVACVVIWCYTHALKLFHSQKLHASLTGNEPESFWSPVWCSNHHMDSDGERKLHLAQWLEHLTVDQKVTGWIPVRYSKFFSVKQLENMRINITFHQLNIHFSFFYTNCSLTDVFRAKIYVCIILIKINSKLTGLEYKSYCHVRKVIMWRL